MQNRLFTLLVLISIVFTSVKSNIEDRFKEDFYNIYKHIAIKEKEIKNEHVTLDKVKYFLFTKKNPVNFTEIDTSNPKPLNNSNVRIVFIIHGWIGNREQEWYEDLTNVFLISNTEFYVVQVDWSDPAHQLYSVSSWNTKDVGSIIGEFIVRLHKNYAFPLKNFLIVGHSLGGQVAGFIGKRVKELTREKLPRIIALDPAGPLFICRPEEERLNKNDAEVVHVIHTDADTFGFDKSCGTIDFFPNGGSSQPGCKKFGLLDIKSVSESIICDHERSWKYFIEAVLNPKDFLASKCGARKQYQTNVCQNVQVSIGDLDSKETGDYYLETNKDEPYGCNSRGFRSADVRPKVLSPFQAKF